MRLREVILWGDALRKSDLSLIVLGKTLDQDYYVNGCVSSLG